MNIKAKLLNFLGSFKNAFVGLVSCLKTERNVRVHMCVAFYILCFMRFYDFTRAEKAVLLLTVGAVIAFEIINTAVETCVDLVTPEYHDLAKRAKDVAAGAVLCLAVFASFIGVMLFWNIEVFKQISQYFSEHGYMLIALIVSFVLWLIFIFSAEMSRTVEMKKDKD